jgi:ferredoxin
VGVYFGRPGVEADDPYFGGVGPRRTGCISCGNCNNGCGRGAVISGPASQPLNVYEVQVIDGSTRVRA